MIVLSYFFLQHFVGYNLFVVISKDLSKPLTVASIIKTIIIKWKLFSPIFFWSFGYCLGLMPFVLVFLPLSSTISNRNVLLSCEFPNFISYLHVTLQWAQHKHWVSFLTSERILFNYHWCFLSPLCHLSCSKSWPYPLLWLWSHDLILSATPGNFSIVLFILWTLLFVNVH